MPKYDISDITPVTLIEGIRLRPWMYVRHPDNPLIDIIGTLTDSFLRFGIREFTISQEQDVFIIKSKQDWIERKSNKNIEIYFRDFIGEGNQGEVFLTAFYYPFYTKGIAGEYGEQRLFDECFSNRRTDVSENDGRILIISKEQRLPEDHGINFERPKESIADLENEKRWLEAAIQSAKMKH